MSNASTCDDGVTAVPKRLINIHSRNLAGDYPSTIAVTNTGDVAKGASLYTINASSGIFYGRYLGAEIPSRGLVHVSQDVIEAAMPFILTTNAFHYNVREDSLFPGFLQHLVTNRRVGVTTDMTTMCRIN